MGNQHSGAHGHSHNGQPCHGHGPAAQHGHSHGAPQQHGHSHGAPQQHGHSHGAPQAHGHSHGGKPCHGHGPAAQEHGHSHGAPQQHGHSHGAPQQHGHSHGGKPCHGHGPAAQQPPAAAHGHSHNGKPCHGHGPGAGAGAGAPPQPTSPEQVEMMKKQKGVQLFMTQMFSPKIPIIWAHFHPNPKRDAKKETLSSGLKIPYVLNEVMNRAEFRAFLEAFLTAQARYDGHDVVRVIEAMQMERQLLAQFGFKDAVSDPEVEIKFQFDKFKSLITQLVMITSMRKYDSMPFLMEAMGLGEMKLPKLPQLGAELEIQRIKAYSREKIMPLLIQFVENNAAACAEDENGAVQCGFIACTGSIKKGVEDYITHIKKTKLTKADETPTDEELDKRWTEYVGENQDEEVYVMSINEEITNLETQAMQHPDQVLGDLKVHPHAENFSTSLVAQQVQQLVVIPLLEQNPVALQFIAKQWSIDLHLFVPEEDGVAVADKEQE